MQDGVELLFDTIELGLGATCANDDRCDSPSWKFRRDLIDQIGKNATSRMAVGATAAQMSIRWSQQVSP